MRARRRPGLSARVRFKLQDYREETGRYERIVSVGMLEHVGLGHYREFFGKVRELLTDDGVAVVHTIGRYDTPGPVNPWITALHLSRHLCADAVGADAGDRGPKLAGDGHRSAEAPLCEDAEGVAWAVSYRTGTGRGSMYDERFCRMWEFYLTACEVGFLSKELNVFQIQLAKDPDAVPETRDYIHEFEAAH